ncbi:MAG: FGGY-family carbohydrate kinase, partial [Eubacteriales bacterium]
TWILPKLLWVRKKQPEIWEKTRKIVQLQDYILKCLGADEYYTDFAEAAFWGFWDTDSECWNEDFIRTFGIDKELMPTPMQSGRKIGNVSAEAAAKTGLAEGTLLALGIGDQNSAAIGAGVVREGMASVSIGTGGLATVYLPRPYRDPMGKTMITNSAAGGAWQMEGLQNGAGGVLRWFRDEVAALEKEHATAGGLNVYAAINRMVESSPPGAKGLIFLPYLATAVTPRYNEFARGTMVGLTFSHSRADMARAVMEGITMEQKDILTSFDNAGVHTDRIRIMGGATNSEVWNQMQADMYGKPVETLKIKDAAVLGAAISAAACCGAFASIREAADALVRTEKEYVPNRRNAELYNNMYGLYSDVYESLESRHVFERLR